MKNIITPFMKYLYTQAVDFVYPPLCIICENPLDAGSEWLCASCMQTLKNNAAHRNACPRCGQNKLFTHCTCDKVWDHFFESIFSVFDFDDTIQHIVHQFKYKGKRSLAYYLGTMFSCCIAASIWECIDLIIPVPLHFFRQVSRGYNQADYFARGVLAGSIRSRNLQYTTNILKRTRYTKTQTKRNKEQRQKILSRAFNISQKHHSSVENKRVLLIDDIITTTATVEACSEVLLKARAHTVEVLCFARA